MTKISIIMPVYNVEKYIHASIESLLNQTFKNFELIIINDGSHDDTDKIIRSFEDDRINYVINPENKGLIYSLNVGLSMATGEYVARMDGDDICVLNRLEKQAKFLSENKNIMILGTAIQTFRKKLNDGKVYQNPSCYEEIKAKAFFDTVFSHPTVMFRRELVDLGYRYDHKYLHSEDSELWCRIISKYCGHNLGDILVHYRIHEKSVSNVHRSSQLAISTKAKAKYLQNLDIELNEFELYAFGTLSKNTKLKGNYDENKRTLLTALQILNIIIKSNKVVGFVSQKSLRYYCLYYAGKYILRNWRLSIFRFRVYFVLIKLIRM